MFDVRRSPGVSSCLPGLLIVLSLVLAVACGSGALAVEELRVAGLPEAAGAAPPPAVEDMRYMRDASGNKTRLVVEEPTGHGGKAQAALLGKSEPGDVASFY